MTEIVPETPALHADQIEALYDRTFGPGHFAKTAERLREGNEALPDISRVALDHDGRVIGVCRVWPIRVERGGRALFVGPVAVDPDWQGKRLGLVLTEAALQAGEAAGWPAALLIGAPSYFGEVGFSTVSPGRFEFPGPQDQARVMIKSLTVATETFGGRVQVLRGPVSAPFAPPGKDEKQQAEKRHERAG